MRKLLGRTFILASIGLLVVACGGGGSGGSGPVTQPPPPPPPPPPPVSVVPDLTAQERFSGGEANTDLTNEEAFGQAPLEIQFDFSADGTQYSGTRETGRARS